MVPELECVPPEERAKGMCSKDTAQHLGGLIPECHNFAPDLTAERLSVSTAPAEGGEDHRNCPTSCPSGGWGQQ